MPAVPYYWHRPDGVHRTPVILDPLVSLDWRLCKYGPLVYLGSLRRWRLKCFLS